MNEIKISEMIEAEEVNDEDLIMIVQGGVNKKVRAEKVGTGNTGGGDSEEIGSVKLWFSNTIPRNWLLCNGQEVSRTEYAELFEILGTIYGEGDDSTTFNLPDMREQVPAGLDVNSDTFNVLGKKVGEKKHTMTIQELVAHTHKIYYKNIGGAGNSSTTGNPSNHDGQVLSDSTGDSQPFNIIQPSIVCNFIIKAKKEKVVVEKITLSEILEEIIKQENEESTDTNTYSAKAIDKMNTYSTQEINTGKMWIDGKTIYRKVFCVTVTENNKDTAIPNGIINNLNEIIIFNAVIKNGFGNYFPVPSISPNTALADGIGIYYNATSGIVTRIGNTSLGTGAPVNIIVEYTKTTD